uniref:Cytochrome P450 n=1 Tax=Chenopodium quinoa TaxID=63459 RepID=A0A803LW48_CHEQI
MSTNMDNVEGNVPIEEHESDNEKSKPKRKRMKDRSEVWEHFIKEETHTGVEARCNHKGEEIGKEIEKCLLDWELEKVFCITVDNASSNDTAIGYMRRKINGWKAGVLKGRFLHMRCVAHIVNLVVSDGLKIVNESITRVRQAVRFIKQSPSRWNSTFLMLDAALVFEYAFERYSEEDPHYVIELNEREGKGCPTSEDWETVRRFSEFLQVFYDLTLRVSGSLHVTSNLFFHELEKYDKYWGDPEKMNMLIFIVVVLDPRYKLDYVEWMLIEIYDSKHAFVLVNNLKESLNALYEEYRGSSGDVIREEVSSSMNSSQFSPKQKKLQVSDYPPGFMRAILQESDTGISRAPTVILVNGSWNYTLTEMNACLAGLQRAVRRSLHVVTLYTDSTSMVQCLRDLRVSDISIIRTVARIRRISNNFDWCSIHKVDRGSVERAHGLVTTANISLSLLHGDTKNRAAMTMEARSKPPLPDSSNDYLPRALPFFFQTLNKYGRSCFVWNGPVPLVTIAESELIREVFMKIHEFQKPKSNPLLEKFMLPALWESSNAMVKEWEEMTSKTGVIDKRKKAIKEGEKPNDDLLGLLLESQLQDNGHNNKKHIELTIEEVINESKLFYIAGQGTTSTLLVWTLIMLGKYQEWQARAREEILNTFGNHLPDFQGLNHLKIVNMILQEVLRLYPTAFKINRTVTENIRVGDIFLPAGLLVNLPIALIQQDEKLWGDDAKDFNPSRFSKGISKATKGNMSFFSFGWGPRICLGSNFSMMEAKMTLALILQRFSFELSPSYAHAPSANGTLTPQFDAPIIFHRL